MPCLPPLRLRSPRPKPPRMLSAPPHRRPLVRLSLRPQPASRPRPLDEAVRRLEGCCRISLLAAGRCGEPSHSPIRRSICSNLNARPPSPIRRCSARASAARHRLGHKRCGFASGAQRAEGPRPPQRGRIASSARHRRSRLFAETADVPRQRCAGERD